MKPLRKYPSIYKFQNGGFTEGDPPVKELPVINLTATRADWEKQKELRKELDKSQQDYNNLILDYGLSADDQKMFGFEDYQGGMSSAEQLQAKINKLNESYTNTQNQFSSANKALVDLRTAYPDEWNNKTVSDVISDSGLHAMQRLNREEKVNNSSYKDFYSNYGSLIDPNIKKGYGPGAAYSTKQTRENWMDEGSADWFANKVNKGVQFGLGLAGGAATGLASKAAGATSLLGKAAPYATAPLTIGSKTFPYINPINTIGLGFGAHSGANFVDPTSVSRQSISKAYNDPTAKNILDATGNVTMDALGVLTSPGMGNALLQGAKGIANTSKSIGNLYDDVATGSTVLSEQGAQPLMLMGPNSWLGRRLFGVNNPTATNAVTSGNTTATVPKTVPASISAPIPPTAATNYSSINPYSVQNSLRNYTSPEYISLARPQRTSVNYTSPTINNINYNNLINTDAISRIGTATSSKAGALKNIGKTLKTKINNLTNSVSENLTKVNEKLGAIIEKKLAKGEPTLSFQEMETEVNNLLKQGVGQLKSNNIGIKLISDGKDVRVQLQLKDFFNQPANKIELEKLLEQTNTGTAYTPRQLTQAIDEWISANSDIYSGILNLKQTGFIPSNRKLTEILSGKPGILPHNFNSYNNTGQQIKQGGLKRAGEFPFANWQRDNFHAAVAEELLKGQGISQEYSKALNEVSKLNNQRLYSGGTGHLSQGAARYTKEFLKGNVEIINSKDATNFLNLLNDTQYLKKVNDFYAKWAKAPSNAKPGMAYELPELYDAIQKVNFMYKKMGGYISPTSYAYGGSLAPNIPTYYNFKGTPIYRDTTALPFANGGNLDGLPVDPPDDPIKSLKGLNVNEVSALIYETVAKIIERKKAEGKIKPGENLDARGVVAQILLESGNAKSQLTAKYNNFGGIKATPGFIAKGGKTAVVYDRNEKKNNLWRAYATPEEGLEAQIDFYLNNLRYRKAGLLNAKNTQEYLTALRTTGYAANMTAYTRKLGQMANSLDKRRKKIAPEKLQTLIQNFTPITNPVTNGAQIVAPINTTANNTLTNSQVVNPTQIIPVNTQQVNPTVTPQIINNNTVPVTNSVINNSTTSNDFLSAAEPISEGSKYPSYYPVEPQWQGLDVEVDYKKGKGFYLPKMTNPEKWGYQPMFKKGNKKHYIPTPAISINETNYTNPIAKAVQYFTGYDPLYYSGYDKEVPFINEEGEEDKKIVHVPGELDKVGKKNWHGFEHPINFQKGYSSIQDIFNRRNYKKEVQEQTLEENRPQMQNEMQRANGGMIKRADGSYSKRGLWDNIRANAGSGKKPTASMLKQERIINSKKSNGGFLASGYGSSLGRYYNVGGNLNNSTDCEPGFIKDENGNCIPDYGCKGDTPCRETDQIQSYYNEAMDIPRQIVNYGKQVAYDYNENNKDPRTYWKKAVDVSESGFPDPSCMGAAGALPRCVPTIKNYMKQFSRAHDFSNYKFTEATKNNRTAYNTVGTYRDPKFDEESKGNVKPGDIVNFMGGDSSPHAMTFAGWDNGKARYLASSGYPGDFSYVNSGIGLMKSPGRKAFVQRFDQGQYVNTMYGKKIKELEEKARNNPTSSGPLYLQPLKPQFINQINTKP